MKKFLLALLFFVVLSFGVSAEEKPENFNDFNDLQIQFLLSSAIDIQPASSQWLIEDFEADLSFFPRTTDNQVVAEINYQSSPQATVSGDEDNIHFVWPSVTKQSLSYGINAKVRITTSLPEIKTKVVFPLQNLPPELLEDTQETEFIDITPEIEAQAKAMAAGKTDLYEVVDAIAQWTKNNVEYDLSTLTATAVQKSSWVLENRKGVCDEITNLFISFLRSLGIPAVFVSGMVYTNLDYTWGPHGWAEVYFPGYGWVPYDVTFGQYGWLDPSHIKLKEDVDSGAPSAEYTWIAQSAEINIKKTDLSASLIATGAPERKLVEISIEPERFIVGPGSVVPIVVTVTNEASFYLTPQITIKKAPKLSSTNVREIALAPGETRKLVWLAEIPTDALPGYIYTSTLEADATFADVAEGSLQYSVDEQVYTRQEAEAFANSIKDQEQKEPLSGILLSCTPDKQKYYTGEEAIITCSLKNQGSQPRQGNLCINEICTGVTVYPGRSETATLKIVAEKTGRPTATFESGDRIAYYLFGLKTVSVPQVSITDLSPSSAEFKDIVTFTMKLSTTSPIQEIAIDFGFGQVPIDTLTKETSIKMTVPARALMRGVTAEVAYKDELGKAYRQTLTLPFEVRNIPWYARLWYAIVGVFS